MVRRRWLCSPSSIQETSLLRSSTAQAMISAACSVARSAQSTEWSFHTTRPLLSMKACFASAERFASTQASASSWIRVSRLMVQISTTPLDGRYGPRRHPQASVSS